VVPGAPPGTDDRVAAFERLVADNPWRHLPLTGELVLPEDAAAATPFDLALPPVPWQGPAFTARVLLLTRNPRSDPAVEQDLRDPAVRLLYRAQLSGVAAFPWFDPALAGTSGARYWRGLLRHLVDAVGEAAIASAFATVQYGAYFSSRWPVEAAPLASGAFTARVVRSALARGAVVIVARADRDWTARVPELVTGSDAGTVLRLTGLPLHRPALTRVRLAPDGFARVVAALTGRAPAVPPAEQEPPGRAAVQHKGTRSPPASAEASADAPDGQGSHPSSASWRG